VAAAVGAWVVLHLLGMLLLAVQGGPHRSALLSSAAAIGGAYFPTLIAGGWRSRVPTLLSTMLSASVTTYLVVRATEGWPSILLGCFVVLFGGAAVLLTLGRTGWAEAAMIPAAIVGAWSLLRIAAQGLPMEVRWGPSMVIATVLALSIPVGSVCSLILCRVLLAGSHRDDPVTQIAIPARP